jgi:hypothetical protein
MSNYKLPTIKEKCYSFIDISDYDKYKIDIDHKSYIDRYTEDGLHISKFIHSSKKYPKYLFYSELKSNDNNKVVSSTHKYIKYMGDAKKDQKFTVNKYIDFVNDNKGIIGLDLQLYIIAKNKC